MRFYLITFLVSLFLGFGNCFSASKTYVKKDSIVLIYSYKQPLALIRKIRKINKHKLNTIYIRYSDKKPKQQGLREAIEVKNRVQRIFHLPNHLFIFERINLSKYGTDGIVLVLKNKVEPKKKIILKDKTETVKVAAPKKVVPMVAVLPAKSLPIVKDSSSIYITLRNNMLEDLVLLPNIGVEVYLGKRFTLIGNWRYQWIKSDKRHVYWRIYGGDLGIRKYFGKAAGKNRFAGFHLGLYGQILTYDIEFGGIGYLGNKWSYGGGLEFGYQKPLTKRLSLDFNIGFGYFGGIYKVYRPEQICYVWQATYKRNYFGPTKLGLTLVWRIGKYNYNRFGGESEK